MDERECTDVLVVNGALTCVLPAGSGPHSPSLSFHSLLVSTGLRWVFHHMFWIRFLSILSGASLDLSVSLAFSDELDKTLSFLAQGVIGNDKFP